MTKARVTEEPRDWETITRRSVVAAGWATAPPTVTTRCSLSLFNLLPLWGDRIWLCCSRDKDAQASAAFSIGQHSEPCVCRIGTAQTATCAEHLGGYNYGIGGACLAFCKRALDCPGDTGPD
jgi:hypothetical protein